MESAEKLKGGDKCIARKIDAKGHYVFQRLTITRTLGTNLDCGTIKFNRKSGLETGVQTGDDLSKWEVFADTPDLAAQMELAEKGELPAAVEPELVRLYKALQLVKDLSLADIIAANPDKLKAAQEVGNAATAVLEKLK